MQQGLAQEQAHIQTSQKYKYDKEVIEMPEIINISGNTYNYLHVIEFSHIKNGKSYWVCECMRCGKRKTLRRDTFTGKNAKIKSCGCWKREESSQRMKQYNKERGN